MGLLLVSLDLEVKNVFSVFEIHLSGLSFKKSQCSYQFQAGSEYQTSEYKDICEQ